MTTPKAPYSTVTTTGVLDGDKSFSLHDYATGDSFDGDMDDKDRVLKLSTENMLAMRGKMLEGRVGVTDDCRLEDIERLVLDCMTSVGFDVRHDEDSEEEESDDPSNPPWNSLFSPSLIHSNCLSLSLFDAWPETTSSGLMNTMGARCISIRRSRQAFLVRGAKILAVRLLLDRQVCKSPPPPAPISMAC